MRALLTNPLLYVCGFVVACVAFLAVETRRPTVFRFLVESERDANIQANEAAHQKAIANTEPIDWTKFDPSKIKGSLRTGQPLDESQDQSAPQN